MSISDHNDWPDTGYPIKANISEFEWHMVRQLRKLTTHGFGSLLVEMSHHKAVQAQVAFRDSPEELKRMQG